MLYAVLKTWAVKRIIVTMHEHKRLIARCLWLTEEDVDAVGSRDIPDRIVGVTLFDGSLDF